MASTTEDIKYANLQQSDNDDLYEQIGFSEQKPKQQRRCLMRRALWIIFICTTLVSFLGGLVGGQILPRLISSTSSSTPSGSSCEQPVLRKEWRSLSTEDKQEYIDAAYCLTQLPSKLGLNHSLHFDFAWVHIHYGGYSHNAPPFLAWHRYFLHVYEHELRFSCGYKGHLPYWDWTLDWENLFLAPVWDLTLGFGGGGNPEAGRGVEDGYCLTNGPFANLVAPYGYSKDDPHCLSRGFRPEEVQLEKRKLISPDGVERLLSIDDFMEFNLAFEKNIHSSIPRIIGGDLILFGAPQDPLWYLHHAQIDRIWWKWQMRDSSRRMLQYHGQKEVAKEDEVALTDLLSVGPFVLPPVQVADIMWIEGDVLCYRY